ncbi:EamA family transporter [Paenibacillus arenosi]|uniref:EamA family transporter n=1 Tax=Paenibacillus arenosi TaxID=2774142 RepID=A0ABR9B0L2_9BACL|nr:EamA family transporter [Paenibacillus arenosi]MBD8498726.1 EamA family transporter [Paenibacillus arenosi]
MSMWLVFALLSAVSAALVAIFGKIGLQGIDPNVATTIRAVIMALFMIAVIVVQGKWQLVGEALENRKALLYIGLSGVAGAASWLFYFIALKYGKVTQVAPIDKLSVVFSIILAMIILGETLNWMSGIGVVLITVGVLFIAFS